MVKSQPPNSMVFIQCLFYANCPFPCTRSLFYPSTLHFPLSIQSTSLAAVSPAAIAAAVPFVGARVASEG